MSDCGVVATVSAPLLKGVTQAELIKFDLEYDAYKDKVADINRSRDSARRITPATMKHCIDPVLLQSLCLLGQIENAENASQATDAKVKHWFDARLQIAPEDLTERVRSALDYVQYKQERRDPSGAALRFVVDVVSALDQNNASEVLDDKDVCKSLIGKLVNKLEPPELRERIRAARECWTADQR